MSRCFHATISGLVQGVFFRASTKDEADRLGISGWVRNLSDGRVEVLACGDGDALQTFLSWLEEGPRHANVTRVDYEWREPDDRHEGFNIV